MRVFALSEKPSRLKLFAAFVAVTMTMLVLSGCGHKCKSCNSCNSCNTCKPACNTCNTCNQVSEAPVTNSTCTTCQTCASGNYDRVGYAPPGLNEPTYSQSTVGTTTYSGPSYTPPAPSYTPSSTSFDRVGESRELPVFSAPATPTFSAVPPAPAPAPAFVPAPVQPQAQIIPQSAPAPRTVHGGGNGQYYTMQPGDTLYGIARKHNVSPKAVLAANHFSDPNHLAVGTKVIIPN